MSHVALDLFGEFLEIEVLLLLRVDVVQEQGDFLRGEQVHLVQLLSNVLPGHKAVLVQVELLEYFVRVAFATEDPVLELLEDVAHL